MRAGRSARRSPPAGAGGARRSGVDHGTGPRIAFRGVSGGGAPGRPPRRAVAAPASRLHGGHGADPDAVYRRDDGHLLRRRRRAPPATDLSRAGAPRDALADGSGQREPTCAGRSRRFPGLERSGSEFPTRGGDRSVVARLHRRRRAGDLHRIARHGRLLRDAGRQRCPRSHVPAGGVPAGQRRDRPDRRSVAAPLRGRGRHHRAPARAGGRALHRDRRARSGLRAGPQPTRGTRLLPAEDVLGVRDLEPRSRLVARDGTAALGGDARRSTGGDGRRRGPGWRRSTRARTRMSARGSSRCRHGRSKRCGRRCCCCRARCSSYC